MNPNARTQSHGSYGGWRANLNEIEFLILYVAQQQGRPIRIIMVSIGKGREMISNDIAVEVDQISKIYRLGVKDKIHDSIGRTVFEFIKSPIHNYRKYRSLYRFDEVAGKNS